MEVRSLLGELKIKLMEKLTKKEVEELTNQGYQMLSKIKDKGLCGINSSFIFTVAIVVGIQKDGTYDHRYCYPTKDIARAIQSLMKWAHNSVTDHPDDSFWIKRKGSNPISNPNFIKS